ncbi:MAG: NAD(P)-dependent oxidoreductase, partial [Cyclobacteriaceae bacterium]|nr:NAD(P)-dependent oxidoreductase [Cyclobacteriaceae bacterium HetDA_MAG_MS6]
MKIMITGANGLLGQKLVQKLSTDPRKNVIATARGTNRNPVGNYTYHTMDIADEQQVASIVDQLRPDVIINTAAMTQVDDCERDQDLCRCLNVEAVRYLVKACDLSNVFLIHLSTDFIFDGAAGPYTEEDEPNPLSYYGQSKLDAEQIIKSSPIRWAIARTMLVYGIAHDMSRSNIILWVKKNLEQGSPIRVVNDQWRMPTLAEDLADG